MAEIDITDFFVAEDGFGIAFSNDWCMDDTYSCVVDGLVHGQQVVTLDVGSTQIPLPYM